MIKNAMQLKALVRNAAQNDSGKAQLLLRNYAMERFLERIALSPYQSNFILKGGMLVSALVGLDSRATQDIDATIRNFPLDENTAREVISQIAAIELQDNMRFEIKDISSIMDEAEYSGLRVSMNAYLESTRIPLKIDISTGDAITPRAVEYSYKLMFEQRSIPLMAYSLETVLAEKIETIISRAALNTRMRDYYDIYILQAANKPYDAETLRAAVSATSERRGSTEKLRNYHDALNEISGSSVMAAQWETYRKKNAYVGVLDWETALDSVIALCNAAISL